MRHIASETFTDEFFGTLPYEYRILWIGLIASVADDQGRFMDNAALIRSIIFPYDEKISIKTIEQGLSVLAKAHRIHRYVAGTNGSGKRLVQIVNWWKYQRSTQWAAESSFMAPSKWHDRVRIHKPGLGNVPYTLNWDSEGGYVQPTKKVRTSFKDDRPKPKPIQRPTPKQKQPTPQPPSTKRTRKSAPLVGGGGDSKSSDSSLTDSNLTPQAMQIAPVVMPMLRSSGLGIKKIETLLNNLATRIEPANAKRYVLAALASAYADKDAKNPPMLAAYRIEHDSVPAIFENSHTWQVIPAAVLKAADVDVTRIPKQSSKGSDIDAALGVSNG